MSLKQINLKTIAIHPSRIYIKLKREFLITILKKASQKDKPHRNEKFCKKIKVKFNNKTKASLTVISWMKYNSSIPLSKLIIIKKMVLNSWEEIEKNVLSLQFSLRGGKININFPIIVDKKVGAIIGHILGDGSIDKKYNQVFFSNSNKELLKEFELYMYEVFKVKPRIWMQETSTFEGRTRWEKRLEKIDDLKEERNCGLFYPSICGVILNNIFKNFAVGKDKKITNIISNSSKDFKLGLLRAFYDDEGTVAQKSLRLFQDKKDILENMRKFLKEFEISSGKTKTYKKKNKERYYFDIHRKSNLIKFREKIGFTSSKKMNKLKEISIIKNYKNSK